MKFRIFTAAAVLAATLTGLSPVLAQEAQMERVPDRRPGEGAGPYRKLVIRGATLIDGTGAPAKGPVDIVIEGNRITAVNGAGTPGLPLKANRGPRDALHRHART